MLKLPALCRAEIQSHAESGYPEECCGILIGKDGLVAEVRRGANLNTERAHDRYLLDPKEQLQAEKEARAKSLEVIGFYHSHPDHPAVPSEFDRQWATWAGYSYVITSVEKGKAIASRSWLLKEDRSAFEEEEIKKT